MTPTSSKARAVSVAKARSLIEATPSSNLNSRTASAAGARTPSTTLEREAASPAKKLVADEPQQTERRKTRLWSFTEVGKYSIAADRGDAVTLEFSGKIGIHYD